MLLECPVPVRDRPGDGDVPESRDDPDGPEEDEDVVPLQDEVQGAGAVPAQSVRQYTRSSGK